MTIYERLYRPAEEGHDSDSNHSRYPRDVRARGLWSRLARVAVWQGAIGALMSGRTDTPTHVVLIRFALACVVIVLLTLAWCTAAHAGRCHSREQCRSHGWAWHTHVRHHATTILNRPRARPQERAASDPPGTTRTRSSPSAFPTDTRAIPVTLGEFTQPAPAVFASLGFIPPPPDCPLVYRIPTVSPEKPRLEDAPLEIQGMDVVASADPWMPVAAVVGCGSAFSLAALALGLGWVQRRRNEDDSDRIISPDLVPMRCPEVALPGDPELPTDPPAYIRRRRADRPMEVVR
jgi:hypothetical protein